MTFKIEVLGRDRIWQAVRPVRGEPYTWDTREGAERAMRIFYPDQARVENGGVRVVEA